MKPKFTTDFLEAVVREGADELTLRRVSCAPSLTPRMWETVDGRRRSWMRTATPPARPFSKGPRDHNGRHVLQIRGAALHQAAQCETSGENKKARVPRFPKEAKDKGVHFRDLDSVKTHTRPQVRLDLWAIHSKVRRFLEQRMFVGPVVCNEQIVKSEMFWLVFLFGLRIMCQQSMLWCENEDDFLFRRGRSTMS